MRNLFRRVWQALLAALRLIRRTKKHVKARYHKLPDHGNHGCYGSE